MLFLRVYLPLAFGYFLSYFFRNVNSLIEKDLVRELDLSASSLGLLTSVYLIAFASTQIPLGIWLDRYGPRLTDSVLFIFAAVGAAVFASADGLPALIVGRLLIGFGVSAALMAAFKAYAQWFPASSLPTINGMQMVAGGLGAVSAATPLQSVLSYTDWRGVFWILSAASLGVSLVLYWVFPRRPAERQSEVLSSRELVAGIKLILRSPVFWGITPLCMLSQASFFAFQGLWAKLWLRDVLAMDEQAAAWLLTVLSISMVAGFLTLGWICTRLSRAGVIGVVEFALLGMSIYLLAQIFLVFNYKDHSVLIFVVIGFFATAGILPYAALSQHFDVALAGRVNTLINLMVFVSAFVVQAGFGVVLDLFPKPNPLNNNPAGFSLGFGLLVAAQVLALAWAVWQRPEREQRRS